MASGTYPCTFDNSSQLYSNYNLILDGINVTIGPAPDAKGDVLIDIGEELGQFIYIPDYFEITYSPPTRVIVNNLILANGFGSVLYSGSNNAIIVMNNVTVTNFTMNLISLFQVDDSIGRGLSSLVLNGCLITNSTYSPQRALPNIFGVLHSYAITETTITSNTWTEWMFDQSGGVDATDQLNVAFTNCSFSNNFYNNSFILGTDNTNLTLTNVNFGDGGGPTSNSFIQCTDGDVTLDNVSGGGRFSLLDCAIHGNNYQVCKPSLSKGAIIGIVVGSVTGAVAIIIIIVVVVKKVRSKNGSYQTIN
ncbi:hypothetical protein SAMD00019534_022780 [Acytostelium subglobosum LB1]|uniref:hypothetical protein n=1 Tax=Acytostelium subglobosum LB1 TaxID=1410327 RepID=UPI0006449466|nr:hypothetical protein SAMD00019534_022780 [Acytostelium subglobosum LB1]GAM19103.1 hypothetical protein SAMD00019534_022780 [Acytostelium subglobosum LB1]|eukprot:XP_012757030.1 hypothetical protein SAMD00019534_022780 [Acytostelium subglobosum LB1]